MRIGSLSMQACDRTEPESASDGVLRIDGRLDWLVSGCPEGLEQVATAVAPIAQWMGPMLRLRFGNRVGRIPAGPLGDLEVCQGEWTDGEFEALLQELCSAATGLPFGAGDGGIAFEAGGAESGEALMHRFAWLRYCTLYRSDHALTPAVSAIAADPHRVLVRVPRRQPIGLQSSVGPRQLMEMLSGCVTREVVTPATSPLAVRLRGFLPSELDDERPAVSEDTAENRFVLAVLREAASLCARVEAVCAERSTFRHRRALADAIRIRGVLAPLLALPVWQGVGRMTRVPAESSVLQRRRGYRAIWNHHVRSRQRARIPEGLVDPLRHLAVRDMASLYELWCFVHLGTVVAGARGAPGLWESLPVASDGLRVRNGYRIAWSDGTEIRFNQTYSPDDSRHRSWSMPLRPDISLYIHSGPHAGLHLFDAKFRYQADGSTDARRARREDLHKMHAYRDAIPAARTAWVLFPGSESRSFWESRDDLRGIGSVAWRPGIGAVPEFLLELLTCRQS